MEPPGSHEQALSSVSFANKAKPAPVPGHWSVRKEGWGWRNLPGISVLSRQADVTGQMAQWPRRSLTVFKLSIQFQNRFGLSESHPTCHTQSRLFTWLMFITCSEGPWTRAWAQVQHFTGQETWTRAFLKGFQSVKWSTHSRIPEGLKMLEAISTHSRCQAHAYPRHLDHTRAPTVCQALLWVSIPLPSPPGEERC